MRSIRLALVALLAVAALSASACTNPVGPKPAGDIVMGSSI